jgi:hypothetical protein
MDQDDGVRQEDHGGEEVHHDEIRVELGVDHDPAEYGLGHHPADQAAAQPDQIPATGSAEDGAQQGRRHRDGQDDGHHPIAEFHQTVELQRRSEVAHRAFGPVGTPQARSGQPDRPPGHHNEGDQG